MALFNYAAALVAACLFSSVAADKESFPLVWVCLGITVVGVIIALYVAYKRPAELHLPGSTVMTMQETEGMEPAGGAESPYEYSSQKGCEPAV